MKTLTIYKRRQRKGR